MSSSRSRQNPVRNNVGGTRRHKFTRAEHPAWATHVGLRLEKVDRFEEALCDER